MSENDSDHERALERALEALTTTDPIYELTRLEPAATGPDAARAREYLEALASLPFAEPPAIPEPATRRALLARVGGAAPAADRGATVVPLAARRSPRAQPWLLALAAALGACVIGLAFLAGQVGEQRAALARLEAQVGAPIELVQDARQLDMITGTARQAYPLRRVGAPVAGEDDPTAPRGIVYVCGRHQQWYLNVRGLEPAPEGYAYNLWFETDSGPVHGGVVEIHDGGPAELEAPVMPEATRSFLLTLEPLGPHGDAPRGEPILIADHAVNL